MDILRVNDPEGELPRSWYAETAHPPGPFDPAEGEIVADVAVVGGGFTGLSAALHAARAGHSVVLIEANRIGSGASGRNGGQVGTGQRVEQPALEKLVGRDDARKLWQIGLEAVALTRALAEEAGGDAGWSPGILHADHRPRLAAESRAHADHMARHYGYELIRYLGREEIRHEVGSPGYHSGTLDMGGAHLHPLRYVFGLARLCRAAGVTIHEQSRMTAIEGTTVVTPRARIRAGTVVLGLNGYHDNALPALARRVMPINNFIAATEPLGDRAAQVIRNGHAVCDSRFVINYFRLSQDGRLLFGGGESYGYRFPSDIAAKVRRPMLQVFPQLRDVAITHAWGGTLGITMQRLPHFAELAPGVFSASGFSGHGIAMGTLAGRMLAEAVGGRRGGFELMAGLPATKFPGGVLLREPLLAAAMTWYALRDRF
ncbi:NAD(P)/FAD-dependent oxidoreductase [Mangrovicoccus algicola]|uniref:FAD-binding oxidoreductase n=1 Tax=Mangrovicoccus algicola TaxID=2771008 RepID=A0A8J7CSU0_9RHOB|nr:FAD-binding oxidoreductase [Mangrovicoccus algicola]MBE3636599.1 FAD-binding oxidoreductase [Mangrovicoccus algicola]